MIAGKLRIESIPIARIESGEAYIDTRFTSLDTKSQIISSPVPNAKDGQLVSELGSSRPKKPQDRQQVAKRPSGGGRERLP